MGQRGQHSYHWQSVTCHILFTALEFKSKALTNSVSIRIESMIDFIFQKGKAIITHASLNADDHNYYFLLSMIRIDCM